MYKRVVASSNDNTMGLKSVDKKFLKRGIRQDLRKAKERAEGYDSFDEMWIVDNIKGEDKIYYGSDADISEIQSDMTVSESDSSSASQNNVIRPRSQWANRQNQQLEDDS